MFNIFLSTVIMTIVFSTSYFSNPSFGFDSELCSNSYPKEKNMLEAKGFYIGMNICDAKKIMTEGKYKEYFPGIHYNFNDSPMWVQSQYEDKTRMDWSKIDMYKDLGDQKIYYHMTATTTVKSDNKEGKVTSIWFSGETVSKLFKSKDMSFKVFVKNFSQNYVKGDPLMDLQHQLDFDDPSKNGIKYYNGDVGYSFFIQQTKDGNRVSSLSINKVTKTSAGFSD